MIQLLASLMPLPFLGGVVIFICIIIPGAIRFLLFP